MLETRDRTPKGFFIECEEMYKKIGTLLGAPAIICTGSRSIGCHLPTSDYDFIIVDSPETAAKYREKKKLVENTLKVKLDFVVFYDKIILNKGNVYLNITNGKI